MKNAIIVASLFTCGVLNAAPISITNPSFEDGDPGPTVTGWVESGGTAASDHFNVVNTVASDGTNAASLRGLWTTLLTTGISQDLTDTFQVGTYELTFDALDQNTNLADTKVFAALYTAPIANDPANKVVDGLFTVGGTWQTFSLTRVVLPGDPIIGQTIGIQFLNSRDADPMGGDGSADGSAGNRLAVDNVALDYVTTVPEPNTMALLGMGLLAGAWSVHRRRG